MCSRRGSVVLPVDVNIAKVQVGGGGSCSVIFISIVECSYAK